MSKQLFKYKFKAQVIRTTSRIVFDGSCEAPDFEAAMEIVKSASGNQLLVDPESIEVISLVKIR